MSEAYRTSSVWEDWNRACKRKQSCHLRLTPDIFRLVKIVRCGSCRSGCSWMLVVSACQRVRQFRCHKWPPLTKFERIHLFPVRISIIRLLGAHRDALQPTAERTMLTSSSCHKSLSIRGYVTAIDFEVFAFTCAKPVELAKSNLRCLLGVSQCPKPQGPSEALPCSERQTNVDEIPYLRE